MSYSAGTKATDSSAKPLHEGVGVVTSDSVAAESLKGDGSFGEGNPKAAVSSQPSKSTTTNTTDTSGATTLNPAVDAEAREAQEGWSETQQLNAGKGLGNTSSSGGGGDTSTTGGAVTGGFAGAAESARDPGVLQPKGKNLTNLGDMEGKTAFGEVGTDKDPSRLAEQKFAQRNAQPGDATNVKSGMGQEGGSKFSGLGDEAA